MKVNEPIALLLEEGEDKSALDGASAHGCAEGQRRGQAARPSAKAAPSSRSGRRAAPGMRRRPTAGGERISASPLARRMAAQAGLDLTRHAAAPARTAASSRPTSRRRCKVRRTAGAGTRGEGGAAADCRQPHAAPAPAASAAGAAYDEIPLTNMRKVIARRLTEAKQTIPHFYLTLDCELDALLAMRAQLNGRDGCRLQALGQRLRHQGRGPGACARCRASTPSWGGDKIYQYRDIDVSVAVAIDGGLITPIVRKADQKGLSTISSEMKDLAERAKDGKLKPEEFQGGGFSISNLGMFGIKDFLAVINPPQACILAVGAGEKRPVVKGDEITIATVMSVSLSTDHRVVDGALGAQFLQEFKKLVEDPLALLL